VSLGKTLNAVSTLGQSSLPVVVAQPDERHANRTAFVLEWYDRHRPSIMSGLNEEYPFLKITRCLGVNILQT